ncbi:MAG: hypothetical protein JRI67_03235 [Deltaproteobacteria bacterium]|nr:hypothetical protein [Deltaproteobacteria bacterium]MBW1931663.1 hypothetical protein [Deltaproteobacteria bacterium]MBW1937773.1 hypothetical protein [Deltaproteobacteria bacterium]MBW1964166.1 hypothetical protein [Deltaproteobacteria bacterium]
MNCDSTGSYLAGFLLSLLLFCPALLYADDEFSFELGEFEKKALERGGYAELKWEHMDINQGSAFARLNLSDQPRSTLDRLYGSLQIDGYYTKEIISFNWLLKASAQQDDLGWADMADVYEAYVSIKPAPVFTAGVGKKSYRWGKGYAWNPVGFINRLKDPNDPEEALEGYITTEVDLIKSFSGPLQTAALTTVILPVWQGVNEDFGETNNVNLAAKLYLLYRDTDIDLILYTGDSRSTRYGLDFSRNLAPNFEIHGELAYVPNQKRVILRDDGSAMVQGNAAFSYLLGLRYLWENDIIGIIEYYHNDAGYTEEEMERFFQLVSDGENQFLASGNNVLLERARDMSLRGYGKPQPGRNYLYVRFTQKEPFDILYFSPGFFTIINLDDKSYSISPEMVYTGFTNWELRLRFSYLNGGTSTEYGEKMNSNKLEFRVRYFF